MSSVKGSDFGIVLCGGANGLGAIRSLARVGVRTVGICASRSEPSMYTRFPQYKHVVPLGADEQEFDAGMLDVLKRYRNTNSVLLPTSDGFVAFMTRNREQLENDFHFCMPGNAVTDVLLDKAHEIERIQRVGLDLPKSVVRLPDSVDELCDELGLPILIKPRLEELMRDLGNRKNLFLRTREEVEQFYKEFQPVFGSLVAQEVILGDDENLWVCNCTFDMQHDLLMAFSFRRLRTSPAHFGVTSYAKSEYNPTVIEHVQRLGKALEYSGNAMVEFKFDPKDEKYKYIELNPRLGMCNYFDTRAGVNNAYCLYQIARGESPVAVLPRQRENMMYLSLYDDFHARLKDGESLHRILGHYASNSLRKHIWKYGLWHDPLPLADAVVKDLGRTVRSVRNKLIGRPKT